MDEQFLHYIWQFQKFDVSQAQLVDGRSINVFSIGYPNRDSGPDFEEARIKIGEIEWVGHVEIHIRSSDWNRHGHSTDKAYNQVILHVVWKYDSPIFMNGNEIPTLELQRLVNPLLIKRYQIQCQSDQTIPCINQLGSVGDLYFNSMLDKMAIERLERKSRSILKKLESLNNDWEAVTYHTLAENFGFSINKLPFQQLIHLLPYPTIKKSIQKPLSTEAMIFGQAGFLEEPVDQYSERLKAEYTYLARKHQLPDPMNASSWKFGRMRPSNFPTLRLSQFASLIHARPKIFSHLISIEKPKEIVSAITINLNTYWQNHYHFGKPRKRPQKRIGQATFDNLIINSVGPLLTAYSHHTDQMNFLNRALDLLRLIKPEYNKITRLWGSLDKKASDAFDSQAMIQLFNEYCTKRKCLQCQVGIKILDK